MRTRRFLRTMVGLSMLAILLSLAVAPVAATSTRVVSSQVDRGGNNAAPAHCGSVRVLIAYADSEGAPTTLQAKIAAEPGVTAVDLFDVTLGSSTVTPTLAQLQQYDLVASLSNSQFVDASTLGDNLADYVDGGGIVVQLGFSFYGPNQSYGVNGRWASGGYSPYSYASNLTFGAFTLGTHDATHPLMQGVTTLNGDFQNVVTIAGGATEVAATNNAKSLVAYRPVTLGHTTVGITAYLGEAATQSGDWGTLIFNAGDWLLGCNSPPCPAGSYSPTGTTVTGCIAADPGYYVASAGSTTQTPADIGFYVDTSGATAQTACPAGKTTNAIASDSASDCVPFSPYQVKQNAAAHLQALLPTGSAAADDLLNRAIRRINLSLVAWRWIGQDALTPLHGWAVFNHERRAVGRLMNPIFAGNATVSQAISDLLAADRTIVVKAINDSSDANAKAIANTKLANADHFVSVGRYSRAILALRESWLAVV